MRSRSSLPADYFEALYAADPDPWRFATSAYEHDKYAATLQALPRPRYRRGLDIGCSIGVLTEKLAERCESLLAVDAAERPLHEARRRCAQCDAVEFARLSIPAEAPPGRFDLMVLSEVLYFWRREDVARLSGLVEAALLPGGDIILVHWLGHTDYPMDGDEAVEFFLATTRAFTRRLAHSRTAHYRLDVLRRHGFDGVTRTAHV